MWTAMVCYSQGDPVGFRSGIPTTSQIPSPNFHDMLYVVLVVTVTDPRLDMGEYFHAACTGSLVSPSLVLTAASCTPQDDYSDRSPSSTVVYQRPNKRLNAIRVIVHPHFVKHKTFNLAIIMVEHSELFHYPTIPQAPHRLTDGRLRNCELSGPGRPDTANFRTISLNRTDAELIVCRSPRAERVCIHFEDIMPCAGDMGSTLTCGHELVAIFTPALDPGRKDSCTNRYGAVFTPVSAVEPWLTAVLETPRGNLQWLNNPWYLLLLSAAVLALTAAIYHGLVELMQHKYRNRFEEATPRQSAAGTGPLLLHTHNPSPTSSTTDGYGSDHIIARTRAKPPNLQYFE